MIAPAQRAQLSHTVALVRSKAWLEDSDGRVLAEGMAYLHLPRGKEREQSGQGTMSLAGTAAIGATPTTLVLPDSRRIAIDVSRDALSECSGNRVLRFAFIWSPSA